jgi:hypothetical protein
MPASRGVRSAFRLLHVTHAKTQFVQLDTPLEHAAQRGHRDRVRQPLTQLQTTQVLQLIKPCPDS